MNDIQTYSCAFLHNYETSTNDALFDEKYKKFIDKCPLFLRGDLQKLRNLSVMVMGILNPSNWEGERGRNLSIKSQSPIQSECPDIENYIVRPCLKINKKIFYESK